MRHKRDLCLPWACKPRAHTSQMQSQGLLMCACLLHLGCPLGIQVIFWSAIFPKVSLDPKVEPLTLTAVVQNRQCAPISINIGHGSERCHKTPFPIKLAGCGRLLAPSFDPSPHQGVWPVSPTPLRICAQKSGVPQVPGLTLFALPAVKDFRHCHPPGCPLSLSPCGMRVAGGG